MIETIAQRLAGFLPQYGTTLWAVLSAPVVWISSHALREGEAWRAVTFWAASFALYTLTRFLMFNRLAEPFAYVAAVFLSNGLHLVLTALGFTLVWRLFRHPLPLGSVLSALAYCWGAVVPIQTVLVILMFGIMRVLDEGLYVVLANTLNGCRDLLAAQGLRETLFASVDQAGALGLWGLGLYALLFLVLTLCAATYAIAFLRGLQAMAQVRLVPLLLMSALGALLWVLAGAVGSGVYLMLLGDEAACLPNTTG